MWLRGDGFRSFASELAVLANSYDLLVEKQPETPPIFFARALFHENQKVFQDVRGCCPLYPMFCVPCDRV
jgi:hypothetical protein